MTTYSAKEFHPGEKVIFNKTNKVVTITEIVHNRFLTFTPRQDDECVCIPAHGDVTKIDQD